MECQLQFVTVTSAVMAQYQRTNPNYKRVFSVLWSPDEDLQPLYFGQVVVTTLDTYIVFVMASGEMVYLDTFHSFVDAHDGLVRELESRVSDE